MSVLQRTIDSNKPSTFGNVSRNAYNFCGHETGDTIKSKKEYLSSVEYMEPNFQIQDLRLKAQNSLCVSAICFCQELTVVYDVIDCGIL